MQLELATLEDIIHELRKRALHFVLVGVEPTNTKKTTVRIGASGEDAMQVLRLLHLGRNVLEESEYPESLDGDGPE